MGVVREALHNDHRAAGHDVACPVQLRGERPGFAVGSLVLSEKAVRVHTVVVHELDVDGHLGTGPVFVRGKLASKDVIVSTRTDAVEEFQMEGQWGGHNDGRTGKEMEPGSLETGADVDHGVRLAQHPCGISDDLKLAGVLVATRTSGVQHELADMRAIDPLGKIRHV